MTIWRVKQRMRHLPLWQLLDVRILHQPYNYTLYWWAFTTGTFTTSKETRSSCKWKVIIAEDIYGGCLCNHTPTKAEIDDGVALKCAYEGCKTGWVCSQFHSSLLLYLTLYGLVSSGMCRPDACGEGVDVWDRLKAQKTSLLRGIIMAHCSRVSPSGFFIPFY